MWLKLSPKYPLLFRVANTAIKCQQMFTLFRQIKAQFEFGKKKKKHPPTHTHTKVQPTKSALTDGLCGTHILGLLWPGMVTDTCFFPGLESKAKEDILLFLSCILSRQKEKFLLWTRSVSTHIVMHKLTALT